MMEASIKAPVIQAAAALGGFMAFLAEFGAERDVDEQAKTRWALEYYSAKHRKSGAQRTPATKAPSIAKAAKKTRKSRKKNKAGKRK